MFDRDRTYRVIVDWAPANELVVSLKAFVRRGEQKTLEMGGGWAAKLRQQLGPQFASELAAAGEELAGHLPDLLVRLCPRERSAEGYICWLSTLSPGDVFEILAPHLLDEEMPILRTLGAQVQRYAEVLATWNERYFRGIDPAILSGLQADAAAKRELATTMPANALVELATGGIDYAPVQPPREVLLVPHYHYRPWNLNDKYRDLRVFIYPCDALPAAPGDPPRALMRLTAALSDESRLRILRHLAAGQRSFTEIVGLVGLSKSTVHHHLVVLRAAGLTRVHDRDDGSIVYSLRVHSIDDLGTRLKAFLGTE